MKLKHLGLALVVLPLAMALGVQGTARADGPDNCIRVLASFFARDANPGLRTNLENVMAVAEGFGVTTGTVISRLTGRTGDVNQCVGFFLGGG